jgi:hydroxyacylglutathione hydrolase
VGGCGKFFEGTAEEMLKNMDRLSSYPEDSLVYCAHEYTESNFRYLSSIDPDTCLERYNYIKQLRADGEPSVPTTIKNEKQYNLFMQCREPRVQAILGTSTPEETMATLRRLKNEFK